MIDENLISEEIVGGSITRLMEYPKSIPEILISVPPCNWLPVGHLHIPSVSIAIGLDHRRFLPQDDITVLELAVAMMIITMTVAGCLPRSWDDVDPEVARHFRIIE